MSSRPPIPTGLNDLQIDDLQFFLDEIPDSMNMEVIDGFFCALVCGPADVPRDEYLPPVFGGKIPEFANQADRDEILGMLGTHYDNIGNILGKGQTYYPFFYADMEGMVTANDWVSGFMRGIDMRRDAWQALMDDELMKPVLALHAEYTSRLKDPEGAPTIPAHERESLVKQLIDNLSALYQQFGKGRSAGG
jgi:uncharacterized protein